MAQDRSKTPDGKDPPNPGIPGWDGPSPHDYDASDYPRAESDAIVKRLIAVSHRAGVILALIIQAKIPLNRFTHEALALLNEQLDYELTPKEEGD